MGTKVGGMYTDLAALLVVIGLLMPVQVEAQPTWKRVIGGIERDVAHSIEALPDGGAVICGSTGSFGTLTGDIYLVRLSIDGARVWSMTMGGEGAQEGKAVVALPEGGFLVIGSTNAGEHGGYDGYLARVTDDGELLWERTYGTPDWDFFESAVIDQNTIVAAGYSYGMNDPAGDLFLVKVDLDGEVLWMNDYGLVGEETGGYVGRRSDGMFVLSGSTGSMGDVDAIAFLIDQDGAEVWSVRVEGPSSERILGMDLTSTDHALLTGFQEMEDGRRVMYLANISPDGIVEWSQPVSSAGNDWEARDVLSLADGRIAVSGYTAEYGAGDRDVSLLFLNASGNFLSGPTYGGGGRDEVWSLDLADDGAFYLAGSTTSYGPGMESMFIIRSDGDTLNGSVTSYNDPVGLKPIHERDELTLGPVPVRSGGALYILGDGNTVRFAHILDATGRIVAKVPVRSGRLELPQLTPGIFVVHLFDGSGGVVNRRVLIE
ncbi:MAG TPA: hypothetical protein PLV08_13365 [Flavobacteriales bacterium]|nr:hypothetical protein [Flavobacteriales bacterium]HQW05916.1 hypothetical protein [Flavobacteriales bacterium]HQY00760.1 hypothetical protein [Flavobacteriales bacterium]